MWIDEIETIEIGVNGEEIVLRKIGRDYSYRVANSAGDWIQGLPDGLVWGDAQALFDDSL